MAVKLQDEGWFKNLPLIGGLAGHALRNLTALVALLGGFLYALIALAYERFYRILGVAPKDVGITPGTVVPRTAVALALFVALGAGTYSFIYVLLLWFLRRRLTPSEAALATLAVLAVAGPIVVSWAIASLLLQGPFLPITASLAVVLIIASLGTMLLWSRRRRQRWRIVILAGWVVVLAFFFYGGVKFTTERAENLAGTVLAGKPELDEITFVFDVHADPVLVEMGAGDAPSQSEYRLYLGEANGWLVLYDPVTHITERVSKEGKSLRFLPEP